MVPQWTQTPHLLLRKTAECNEQPVLVLRRHAVYFNQIFFSLCVVNVWLNLLKYKLMFHLPIIAHV